MKKIVTKAIKVLLVLVFVALLGGAVYFAMQSNPTIESKVNSVSSNHPNSRIVLANSLNVRACSSTECSGIGYLYAGDKVEVKEEKDGWCKIEYNKKDAYVSCSYLSK